MKSNSSYPTCVLYFDSVSWYCLEASETHQTDPPTPDVPLHKHGSSLSCRVWLRCVAILAGRVIYPLQSYPCMLLSNVMLKKNIIRFFYCMVFLTQEWLAGSVETLPTLAQVDLRRDVMCVLGEGRERGGVKGLILTKQALHKNH